MEMGEMGDGGGEEGGREGGGGGSGRLFMRGWER